MTTVSRVALVTLVIGLTVMAAAPPVPAAEVTQSFAAPMDRVWEVVRAVLRQQDWEIDKEDRTIGWISTKPRRVEGEEYGVYMKGTVHKLVLHVKAASAARTTIGVERSVFKRERIMWIEKDEPVTVTDRAVEKALLAAVEKSL
jgi:hypothetical protein